MNRLLSALALVVACSTSAFAESPKPSFGTWGVDLSAMDRSIKPGDDFFLYSNGNWLKAAVIPPDRASTGSFQDLQILSENRMKEIVAGIEQRNYVELNPEERKIAICTARIWTKNRSMRAELRQPSRTWTTFPT
jgi:predicted metalloendopeptidase